MVLMAWCLSQLVSSAQALNGPSSSPSPLHNTSMAKKKKTKKKVPHRPLLCC
uniref:Uncharacterized protein n=1 Tax=Physcomitrium patens TaxID=3218 RepID=A0A2K1ICY9_PHYPA|nr:hypothetical protein PHYPA_030626 [Physcomitrium patens]